MMNSTSAFQHLSTPPGFARRLVGQSATASAHANAEVLIAEVLIAEVLIAEVLIAEVLIAEVLTSGGVSRSVLTG
jgi:hypothetical protein